jgi:hypothetical protein
MTCDPPAGGMFIVDRLNTPPSESLVRLVANRGGMDAEVGLHGQAGLPECRRARAGSDPSTFGKRPSVAGSREVPSCSRWGGVRRGMKNAPRLIGRRRDVGMSARPLDAQPFHHGLQRGAFQAESRGGARGSGHHPLGFLERAQDVRPFRVSEGHGMVGFAGDGRRR